MRARIVLPAGTLLLLLSACQLFQAIGPMPPATPTSTLSTSATLSPQAPSLTSSSIPTAGGNPQPSEPAASLTPIPATPTPPRIFPSLQETPATTQIPPMAEPIPRPAGEINILLLGSDQRPEKGFRTDVIMWLTLKPGGSVSLTSFPRDLYVYIPGWRMQRINVVQPYGGFNLSQMTFDYNFGIRPDHYILTNFYNFQTIIESLGGIDVTVTQPLHDARDGYPAGYTVNPGLVHMDGETALWYVRARMTTGDLDRERRAQEVIVAIGQKLFSLNALGRVPELYQLLRSTVETDLSLDDLLQLLPLLLAIHPDQVYHYMVGTQQVTPWVEPASGADLLLPKPVEIRKLLIQAMGTP